jgi:hypothetical protein
MCAQGQPRIHGHGAVTGEKAPNRPHLAAPLHAVSPFKGTASGSKQNPPAKPATANHQGSIQVNDDLEEKLGFDVSNGPAAPIECHCHSLSWRSDSLGRKRRRLCLTE